MIQLCRRCGRVVAGGSYCLACQLALQDDAAAKVTKAHYDLHRDLAAVLLREAIRGKP